MERFSSFEQEPTQESLKNLLDVIGIFSEKGATVEFADGSKGKRRRWEFKDGEGSTLDVEYYLDPQADKEQITDLAHLRFILRGDDDIERNLSLLKNKLGELRLEKNEIDNRRLELSNQLHTDEELILRGLIGENKPTSEKEIQGLIKFLQSL